MHPLLYSPNGGWCLVRVGVFPTAPGPCGGFLRAKKTVAVALSVTLGLIKRSRALEWEPLTTDDDKGSISFDHNGNNGRLNYRSARSLAESLCLPYCTWLGALAFKQVLMYVASSVHISLFLGNKPFD